MPDRVQSREQIPCVCCTSHRTPPACSGRGSRWAPSPRTAEQAYAAWSARARGLLLPANEAGGHPWHSRDAKDLFEKLILAFVERTRVYRCPRREEHALTLADVVVLSTPGRTGVTELHVVPLDGKNACHSERDLQRRCAIVRATRHERRRRTIPIDDCDSAPPRTPRVVRLQNDVIWSGGELRTTEHVVPSRLGFARAQRIADRMEATGQLVPPRSGHFVCARTAGVKIDTINRLTAQ